MREALWLVKNGVPFDVAFSVDAVKRHAWSIMFSEMEGNEYDWDAMTFKKA